ncbi:MAG: GatB/YqeY domain-containing protein [Planctomycetota bacterium]
MKTAMKAGDAQRRDTLRMVIAAIKRTLIDSGGRRNGAGDETVTSVLLNSVKSRTDSAQQYEAAGRPELAAKELAEIEVIQGYLPKQLSAEETEAIVRNAIAEVGATGKQDWARSSKRSPARAQGPGRR